MNTRRELINKLALGSLGAAALGVAGTALAAPAETGPVLKTSWGGLRTPYPNVELRTQDNKAVRFYDDLLRDKIVAINMIYAECQGICPAMTNNLLQVQKKLGDRVGRDVHMYSISVQPEIDTPAMLKEYMAMHNIRRPGWTFLTGTRKGIDAIRYRLGFYDLDPELDRDKNQHTGMVAVGYEPYDWWCMTPAMAEVDLIAQSMLRYTYYIPKKRA